MGGGRKRWKKELGHGDRRRGWARSRRRDGLFQRRDSCRPTPPTGSKMRSQCILGSGRGIHRVAEPPQNRRMVPNEQCRVRHFLQRRSSGGEFDRVRCDLEGVRGDRIAAGRYCGESGWRLPPERSEAGAMRFQAASSRRWRFAGRCPGVFSPGSGLRSSCAVLDSSVQELMSRS